MTSAKELWETLKDVPKMKGVYLYSDLPSIPMLNDAVIIINYVTAEEVEKGMVGHWVCLDSRVGVKKGGNDWTGMYFFDPYGLSEPDSARDIMGLPNTHNIMKLIERTNERWTSNDKEFQVLAKFDDLCGVYSAMYVIDPNFKTNKLFFPHQDRMKIDKNLMKIFVKLGFVKENL